VAGIHKSDDGDINVSNVDMSSKSDGPSSSSSFPKPSSSGSSGSVNNGIVAKGNVTITGPVAMGQNNHQDNRRR